MSTGSECGTRPVSASAPRWSVTATLGLAAALTLAAAPAAPVLAQEGEPEMDRFLEECGGEQGEGAGHGEAEQEGESRFSDQCQPLEEIPSRPRPIIELGTPFLGTGNIGDGFTLPTGAVWQPSFLLFGSLRTALQGGRDGLTDSELVEAVARLDLFGNLYLTQTERVVVGYRPLDEEGAFTRYTIRARQGGETVPGVPEEFQDELNGELATLFFEGDLNEIFPNLDNDDSGGGSWYFSVGRQPLAFQDGMIVNEDQLDMVGLTRANLKAFGSVNTRITGVYAWGAVNRLGPGNARDRDAQLFGLFSEIDTRATTLEIDAAYVMGGDLTGDGVHVAIGDTRRIGRFNNTFRVLASFPAGDEFVSNTQGFLVHDQFSWTPHHNHNLWYIGAFVGIESYRPAAVGPSAGGALGRTGILFAAPGIGRIGAPLGGTADDAAGGSIGHQMFFGHTRQQLIVEVGARTRYKDPEGFDPDVDSGAPFEDVLGGGFRYQAAMGRRFVFLVDGIGTYDFGVDEDFLGDDESRLGLVGRVELSVAF
ncbi:MAG: hypothetical protein PVI57_01700 [Gemmatimonadota bacterium]|jgi:hypothetical protein